jgi:adenylosuccinate lyase
VARINEIEKTTNHDVIAFTTNLAESIGEAARFVHYGLTSSDVVDTANALLLRDACDLLLGRIEALLPVLKRRAFEFKDTPQVGRTHGIHAEPTSFGLTFVLWYDEMRRNRERLERARAAVAVGKISGAVGAFALLDPEVEEKVCARLGLKAARVSTQIIQRDTYAEYLSTLALIASSLEKFALQVRHWQRTEVREAQERFSKGKGIERCRRQAQSDHPGSVARPAWFAPTVAGPKHRACTNGISAFSLRAAVPGFEHRGRSPAAKPHPCRWLGSLSCA